jgi:hypothetical protein
MHFFGMIFWLVVLWFGLRFFWRRQCWAALGPRDYAPWWYSRPEPGNPSADRHTGRRPRRDDQQDYIDALESRVSELEERLDFTERLLAGRKDS